MSLLERLRSRKIVQWSIAYLVAAWVVLQVVDVVGESWGWPTGLGRALTVVAAVGLLVVVTLAWYHGEQGRQKVSGPEAVILSVLLVIGAIMVTRVSEDPTEPVAARDDGGPVGTPDWLRPDDRPSIAVLPFEDLSGDAQTRPFVEGLHNAVVSKLQAIGSLHVIARTSVLRYRDVVPDLRRVGEELGVATVLTGTVQRGLERVQVSVQLVSTSDDAQLWSQLYDTGLTAENVFAVQADLAEEIAARLGVRVSTVERARMTGRGTESLRALDLYDEAQAIEGWNLDRSANERHARLLEEALELDPTFNDALARLAGNFALRPQVGFGLQWADSGLVLARKALESDSTSPWAWQSVASAHLLRGRLGESREAALRAHALSPADAELMNDLSVTYGWLGECDQELFWSVRASRADPLDVGPYTGAAWANMCLGRWEEAERWFRVALEVDPEEVWGRYALILLEVYRDRVTEARRAAHTWLAGSPRSPWALYSALFTDLVSGQRESLEHAEALLDVPIDTDEAAETRLWLAQALLRDARTARATRLLEEAEQVYAYRLAGGAEGGRDHWWIGVIRAIQGRHEEALEALTRAVDDGLVDAVVHNPRREYMPGLESVWADSRFQALLERMRERQLQMRARVEAVADAVAAPTLGEGSN